jgi:hypothetical protein
MREMRTQDSVKNYMSEKVDELGHCFMDWLDEGGRTMGEERALDAV